jgi:hypothetical protein
VEQPLPEPVYLNLEYFFLKVFTIIKAILFFVFSVRFLLLIQIIATLIVIFLITWIIYSLVRIKEIQQEEGKKGGSSTIAQAAGNEDSAPPVPVQIRNENWEAIRVKLLSDSPSDWRLAIIEADIYLDKLLDQKGFHGDTISEKLKQVTPDKLGSIQMAWEAHKVRNRIAHEGAAFALTMPEARRILSYYEIIFRDFGVIG